MLILMQGASGSGKSTVAMMIYDTLLINRGHDTFIFSADNYMTDDEGNYRFDPSRLSYCHQSCRLDVERILIHPEVTVIVDNTNTTRKEAQPYLDMAKKYGHKVQVIRVDSRDFQNLHGVPSETIERQRGRMEDLL